MLDSPRAFFLLGWIGLILPAGTLASETPRELGLVRWGRSLEAGLAESRTTGKPVLLLFQEVPGCATCVDFGAGPLSHPLLVDAIESEFVPVAVYNNLAGADADQLRRFGEPACNNPVLRVLSGGGRDLLPRRAGIYDERGVASRLAAALEAAKRPVPEYLRLAWQEEGTEREPAAFAMHCFWEGEAALGALEGVVATRAGFLDGAEAVELSFDPRLISYPELVKRAAAMQCASRVFARSEEQLDAARRVVGGRAVRNGEPAREAKASDQKVHLGRSPLRFLPLTPLQATRVNAALAAGDDPSPWLSPRQRVLAREVESAFRREPGRFEGFERPGTIAALHAYEGSLRTALARARPGGWHRVLRLRRAQIRE